MKDIEKDLIENDPSKGSQTDRNTQNSDEDKSNTFETIEPEKDNPVNREFEIGHLGREYIKNDELNRDEIAKDEFNRDEWSGNFLMYLDFHANTLMRKTSLATAPIA